MVQARTAPDAPPVPTVTLGRRLFFAGAGVVFGLLMGFLIWAFDALSGQHHDYLVTGLVLMIVVGGAGFFAPSPKSAWRDFIAYLLLLGFLDN